MKKEAQFIEHRFGKFRHRKAPFYKMVTEKMSNRQKCIEWGFRMGMHSPRFIESYLHGSPEAHYYGLN